RQRLGIKGEMLLIGGSLQRLMRQLTLTSLNAVLFDYEYLSYTFNPALSKAQSTNAVGGFWEFFLPLQQLVTSGVGLSLILGNPGSRITGSAGNIGGHSSIGRSMSSGGGLSIPCLTSILNLNTNSGFGNLSV
ncbi:transcription regulator NOT2/NOT3/NOT5-like protein, partial [Tanacetum coccineum]